MRKSRQDILCRDISPHNFFSVYTWNTHMGYWCIVCFMNTHTHTHTHTHREREKERERERWGGSEGRKKRIATRRLPLRNTVSFWLVFSFSTVYCIQRFMLNLGVRRLRWVQMFLLDDKTHELIYFYFYLSLVSREGDCLEVNELNRGEFIPKTEGKTEHK